MHAYACVHIYMHVKHDKHGCLHGGSYLQFIYMYILVLCLCIHVCPCGGMWGYLQTCHTHPIHPTPTRARGPQITKNAVKLELIQIIQFYLKIWNLCTFLHSYRLGLVCKGGVPSQILFFTFGPKKLHDFCFCDPIVKPFPVYTLESDRLCLDSQLI